MSNTPFSFTISKEVRDSKIVIVIRWDGELTAELAYAFIARYLEEIDGLEKYYSLLDLGLVVTSTAARELLRQSMTMVQIGLVKQAIIGHTSRQRILVETFLLAKDVPIGSKTKIFMTEEDAWDYLLADD
ncbi:MAG: hypothetical protein ACTSYA_01045 [Candidatus Kariarchaeaceae archaeon]